MGEVYRARAHAAEGVVKELCVKLIRKERLARPGASARFVGEARLSMRLNHGNIVPVFDFGRCGEDYYLAMERVDGVDLETLLSDLRRRGELLPPEVAAHVVAEVARALSYAHGLSEPVVHCDVKPANVLVSGSGDVKLADFGLATVARDAPGRAGTPKYMAPEQHEGGPVGPATDLWALGLLLTEATSGGLSPRAVDEPELAAIAMELVRPSPEERTGSATVLANRLEAFVARARADGSGSPRERLGGLARRAARPRSERTSGELATTASFVRDGPNDAFLRSMSMLSTVPPSTPEPIRERSVPALGFAAASLALVAGLVILSFALTGNDGPPPAFSALRAGARQSAPPAAAESRVARGPEDHGAGSAPAPADGRVAGAPEHDTTAAGHVARSPTPTAAGASSHPTEVASSRPARVARPNESRGTSVDDALPPNGSPVAATARPAAQDAARRTQHRPRTASTSPRRPHVAERPSEPVAPARLSINAVPWGEVENRWPSGRCDAALRRDAAAGHPPDPSHQRAARRDRGAHRGADRRRGAPADRAARRQRPMNGPSSGLSARRASAAPA